MAVNSNYALVLCAGFGSRMGALSKELPKPLWPIFGTTILGHILNQLQKLNFEKIYVNAHHLASQVEDYVRKNYPSVEVLKEDPILDSGGALLNCAQALNIRKGYLYTFNGDNLIDLSGLKLEEKTSECTLFSEVVPSNAPYNRLLIEQGLLKEIIPASSARRELSNLTYAGISVFNLSFSGLWQTIKPLGIFKDLLKFERDKVRVEPYQGKQVDLGTLEHYHQGLKYLGDNSEEWIPFLKEHCAFQTSKFDSQSGSYNAPLAFGTFNFSSLPFNGEARNVIFFEGEFPTKAEEHHLYWKGKGFRLA